jgi:hypothetical protein
MRNIILAEGKHDRAFILSLLKGHQTDFEEIEVSAEMGGWSPENLKNAVQPVKNRTIKNGYQRIGIIIDLDQDTEANRVTLINKALEGVFDVQLPSSNEPVKFKFEDLEIEISCYFIAFDKVNELEGYLMKMAQSPANYANCLEQWRNCIGHDNISDKEFRKLWVYYYIYWDTSSKKERRNAVECCTVEYSLLNKPQHWNFDIPELDTLKTYLLKFN